MAGEDAPLAVARMPGLDIVRGVAVLMVMLHHTSSDSRGIGNVGVTIFFVLSGFLITRLVLEGTGLKRFYARRATRLLPALLLAVAFAGLANAIVGLPVLRPAVATLTYTANYASVSGGFGGFDPFWSLSVEEHFYLVWPAIVAVVGPRRLLPVCIGLALVVALARYHVTFTNGPLAYRASHLRVDGMLMGATLAVLHGRPPRVAVWATATLIALCSLTADPFLTRYGLAAVTLAAVVVVAAARYWTVRIPWLERVGVISYGLYLFHLPMRLLLEEAGVPWAPLWMFVGTFVVAELSYRLVESPVRAWLNPRFDPKPKDQTAAL